MEVNDQQLPAAAAALPENRDFSAWFGAARHRLSGGGLWLDGGEPGRQDPEAFTGADLKVLICRLSSYADVASSITHRMLYWAVRQLPGAYVDLAFLPPAGDIDLLTREQVPWWLAGGCKRSPGEFDVVAISISVPQEALNLPAVLRHSGIPLGAAQRLADPALPLVVLGGNAAGAVPFLHGDVAPGAGGLVDVVCIGDGIDWLQKFLCAWKSARAQGVAKSAFLARLAAELPGTYVPSLVHQRAAGTGQVEAIAAAVAEASLPVAYRTEPPEVWSEAYDGAFVPFSAEPLEESLPLSLGCAYRCRFCQTGWQRGVFTVTPPVDLVAAALRLKQHTAAADLNLLAADACSATGLGDVLAALQPLFPRVSIKSLAISSLARDAGLRAWIRQLRKREFSVGVEGVSARLRHLLGKPIDTAGFLTIVRDLAGAGVRQFKLFFILTGLETDRDIRELRTLLTAVSRGAPGCRVIASFTPLFHAPFTPLQFAPICTVAVTIAESLETTVRQAGTEFRWSCSADEVRFINLLTRAGRAATPVLVDLSVNHAVRYGEFMPRAAARLGERLLAAQGLDVAWLAQGREEADRLPWDDIEGGTPRARLWAAWQTIAAQFTDSTAIDTAAVAPATVAPAPRPGGTGQAKAAPASPVYTWQWWTWLSAADGLRPDVTLARAFLRERFAQDEALARAFWGGARLTRMPDCGGWALLTADFHVEPPASSAGDWRPALAGGAQRVLGGAPWSDPGTGVADDWLWWLALSSVGDAEGAAADVVKRLRERGLRFQSRRFGERLWHVIEPGYRKRHGVWAVCESGPTAPGFVLATRDFATGLVCWRSATVPPVVSGVYVPGRECCPHCRAPLPTALLVLPGALELPCLACGGRERHPQKVLAETDMRAKPIAL